MSHPKKRHGFRAISVKGSAFRWRFHPCADNSHMTVQSATSSGRQLSIVLTGWRDPWLCLSGFNRVEGGLVLHTEAQNEPQVVTAKFAREAILHCLSAGWKPEERGPCLFCVYRGGAFSALSSSLETLMPPTVP